MCECCSWELSGAKQSRIIAFPVLHTVVLLTGRQTTATLFFSGTVTLLIPLQLMCLCSLPPQAVSTLLFCVQATASPLQCVLLSQDTLTARILKAVAFPTLWRTRKAKSCFPRPPWNDVSSYHQADLIMPWFTAHLINHINVAVNWVDHSRVAIGGKKMMKLVTDWISVRHKIPSNLSKLVP